MRILYAGSPAIAVPVLEALYKTKDIELIGVLTNPDTPRGRHGTPVPTDVGEAALRLGLTTLKPEKLETLVREQVSALKPDLLVSFAYGRIFGPKFLSLFPFGGINIHPSLLPKFRGPTPIQAAILNRETVTGITVQTLLKEMDSGDILAQEQLQLNGKETNGSLSEIAAVKAAEMLPDIIKKINNCVSGNDNIDFGKPQNHNEATYCKLISKEDGFIDWCESAVNIEAKIRAFNPWPLCRTIHDGRELILLKADVLSENEPVDLPQNKNLPGMVLGSNKNNGILIQTGDGILAVTELQYQAKKALFWRDFLNGARDFAGSQLK